ncbi:hypothetical protein IT417_02105 [bacterium]|nr:hypothetical protein [bacterium]
MTEVRPNGLWAVGITMEKQTKVYEIRNTSLTSIAKDAGELLAMLSSQSLGIHRITSWAGGGQSDLSLNNISILMVAVACNGNIVDSGFYMTEIQKNQEDLPGLVHAGTYVFDGKTMIFLEDK